MVGDQIEKSVYEKGIIQYTFISTKTNSKKTGTQHRYKNGKLYATSHYKDGVLDGLFECYGGGYTVSSCTYVKGKKEGIYKTFINGIQDFEAVYQGNQIKSFKFFYPNHRIRASGHVTTTLDKFEGTISATKGKENYKKGKMVSQTRKRKLVK